MIEMFISPVYDVKSIEIEKIQANEYNPNCFRTVSFQKVVKP